MNSGRRRSTDERGVVLVWLAILLVVLLGITALGIDVAYWQVTKNREQRAADAAALAGAVTFPGDLDASNVQAQGVAGDNGYSVGSVTPLDASGDCSLGAGATTAVCTGAGDRSYQYKVTVKQKVNNFFGGIFGIHGTTVKASAQAEFLGPLKMGSPSSQYGNDPDATNWPIDASSPPQSYPNFWGNINGGGTAVEQGDAYAANWCNNTPTDGCTANGDGNNSNYTANGYYYTVDFTQNDTAQLQAFDPALVDVGQFCNNGSLATAAALANIPGYPQGAANAADIARRFRPVANASDPTDPGFQYCTGDNAFPNSAGATVVPTTTYTVLKATVPGHPESATQVCGPISYQGYNGNIATALQTNTPNNFAKYFRQWATLCTVTGNAGDEYFIQVQTDNGAGSNHFALRGVTSGNSAANVTVAGNTYMGMWANVGSNQLTKFYLVRVPSAAKGHTLVLNFYDIGDANSQGTLQVVPPSEATGNNISGGIFNSGCTWTGNSSSGAFGASNNSPGPPWGTPTDLANCKITGVNGVGTWNAQWSTVAVQIPSDYTCDDGGTNGCWFTIDYQFNGQVHDVTSWTAALLGDPVRLVK